MATTLDDLHTARVEAEAALHAALRDAYGQMAYEASTWPDDAHKGYPEVTAALAAHRQSVARWQEANARFIAAARSLVPKMADRIQELEAQLKTVCQREAETIARYDARIEALQAEVVMLKADLTEARRRRDQWMAKAEGFEAIRKALREKVGAPWPPHLSRLLWAGIAADEKARADEAEAEVARLRKLLAEADRWIAWQSHGFESDFAEDVKAAIAKIKEAPNADV